MSTLFPPISKPGEPTWEIALLFPPQGEWSEREFLVLNTDRRVEFSDGFLEVHPMATWFHQLIVKFLLKMLDAFLEANPLGTVVDGPLPVKLWAKKYRSPDIVFLRKNRVTKVHGQPEGADLVMEVVSEGEENRERDLEIKRQEYGKAGISEYWIIDPLEQRITVLVLDGNAYREHGVFGLGTLATSVLLPGFSVSVDAVFAAGNGSQP